MVEIDLNEKDNADISNVNNSILYLINYFYKYIVNRIS